MKLERAIITNTGRDDLINKPFLANELFSTMTKHLRVCYTWADIKSFPQLETVRSHLDASSFEDLSNELLLELK